jgi:site-specific DNA-methyltransferase (adenine-specific)
MGIDIINADAVQWARGYDGPLFHAMLCDPPYHLTSIVKRFGSDKAAPAQFGKDGAFARASKGFMGKQWDGGDVAFNPETWYEFSKVLYPGAFGMAFASSRGWHRLACAIEDGGLIIHPSIFGWAYGSGFPKATRVKADGFDGHRYGLQALKPALEPIIVFQKPYAGRPIDNITASGAGALNIDGGRIATDDDNRRNSKGGENGLIGSSTFKIRERNADEQIDYGGRWPSNFILLDDDASEALDRQAGYLESGQPVGTRKAENHIYGKFAPGQPITGYGDSGGASRFFYRVQAELDQCDPVYYCAKASTEERDAGLGDFEMHSNAEHDGRNQYKNGPNARNGSGKPVNGNGQINPKHNPHPTVKPLDLARYLATLLLPPTEYSPRRLFIPFAGVGSECIGAFQAGWDEVQGVELTAEYIPIANARIEYWRARGWQISMFDNSLTQQNADV